MYNFILKTVCHNEQSAAVLSEFGFGHILGYAPSLLILGVLHLTHPYTP